MRTRLLRVVSICVGLAAGLFAVNSNAAVGVTFSAGINIHAAGDFYDPLAEYGTWENVGSYGRCWHPARVDSGWRPYADGHWEWTDCGWYWVSDEPWSWACYHYGSWAFDPSYGWVWIPGTEWAPAWVTWRESPDYIGWAPCGPRGAVLAPSLFCFVDIHHFSGSHHPRDFIVNDRTVIERTRVISTNVRRENRTFEGRSERVVINSGPSMEVVQKATGTRFSPRPVREIVRQEPLPQKIRQEKAEPWRRDASPVINRERARENTVTEPRRDQKEQQQPRTSQTPPTRPQAQQPVITPERKTRVPEPSGREQPRIYQEPPTRVQPPTRQAPVEKPSVREPVAPERPPIQPLPPTGRDRGNEQKREIQPPTRQAPVEKPSVREPVAPERPPVQPLPPTGRERGNEQKREAQPTPRAEPRQERPTVREEPARPAERPSQPDRGRDKDKDKP
jgi:hypothetical protein